MRRLLTLALCAALLLAAPAALADEYTVDGVLCFTYPGTMTLDTETYADESDETYQWLCMLYDDDYVVDACAEIVDAYADINMSDISDADLDALVQYELEEYADYGATLHSMPLTDEGLPFYVLRMQDEDVAYYLACTVLNGYVFEFDFSMADGSDPDEALEALMEEILASFHSEWTATEADA